MADLGNIKELNGLINKVIELIRSDMDLCKYIKYNTEYPLEEADFKTSELIRKNICPVSKTLNTTTEASTFVNIYIKNYIPARRNHNFSVIAINIDILCHLNLWMLDGEIRPYVIASKIDELMKATVFDEAYSTTELDAMDWKVFSDDYHGYRLTYELVSQR